MRYSLITALIFCFITPAYSQSLTGIWKGTRTQNPGGCFPEYSLELHITWMNNNSFMGNAFSGDKERFTKVNFTGRYNPTTKRMVIIESAVLQFNVPNNCIPCIKTYDLTWSQAAGAESLLGEWKGHEMGNSNLCQPGKIALQRSQTSTFPVDVFQNDTLSNLQKNLKLQSREKELVRSIAVDTSKIKIELYDNAEIDGDTVSIFLNNTLLLYKKRLTDRPLVLNVDVFPNTDYELMMYADNLGRIPPNTSLMIITAGKKRYEMRISSSEQKSAVVQFKYEKALK
jgi:hypothetical protein